MVSMVKQLLAACAMVAVAAACSEARLLLQDDAAGTTLTGPHTEFKTYPVAAGGCQTFETTPDRAAFNYTSTITYTLPSGCKDSDLEVSKVYARGACADTRANNYAVKSLGIVNSPTCAAVAGNTSNVCTTTFGAAPSKAIVTGISSGSEIDSGEICWPASFVYSFVKNSCSTPITVTVTNLFNDYSGSCTASDGDDGDHTATASNSGGDNLTSSTKSGGSGLSTGAKVGIAIGVIAAIAIIAAASYFFCCQLGRS